jgi:sugar lactone lactonase YvrE
MLEPRAIVTGMCFTESPRWHDGELWFTDIHGRQVFRFGPAGTPATVVSIGHDRPSGLGWLPDGRLLMVAMETKTVIRVEPDGTLSVHADLSSVARGVINDMIVSAEGIAYVGDMGAGHIGDPFHLRGPGQIIMVSPRGEVAPVADDLQGPNGHALTEDGRTLVVAESRGARLVAFDVGADGTLHDRRIFATIEPVGRDPGSPAVPDGICLDASGAVWVADVGGRQLLRLAPSGTILERVTYRAGSPIACVLAGVDRRTLYVCAAHEHRGEGATRSGNGWIDACQVAVPGAGRP